MILGSGSSVGDKRIKATLMRNGLRLKDTYADNEGKFSFFQLTEGDYEVKIEADGYQPYVHRAPLRYPGHEEEHFSARLTPLSGEGDPEDGKTGGDRDQSEEAIRRTRLDRAFHDLEFSGQLTPLLQIEASRAKIRAVMGIPSAQVRFEKTSGGVRAEMVFTAQIYKENGQTLAKKPEINRGFILKFTRKQFEELGDQPLLAQNEVPTATGSYTMVLLVEDRLSGSFGTIVRDFQVP